MHTKIQHQGFETGEFTDAKDRTAQETIDLITNFPWQKERGNLTIDLTNPGITIEGRNNDYLKLTPYYSGKYVLHYLDAQHHLYTRSFDQLPDTFPIVRSFFDDPTFNHTGFNKEMTLLKSITPHFVTRDFVYTLNKTRLIAFCLILTAFFSFELLILVGARQNPIAIFIPLVMFIFLLVHLALFINHYRAARNRILIVSKGHDEFSYGPVDNPKIFYKHDIQNIVTYGSRGRNGNYGALTKVEIDFADGSFLTIPCLMISQDTLVNKFPQIPQSTKRKLYPFIPRDASALFG